VNKKETNRLLGMKNDELKIGSMRDELSRWLGRGEIISWTQLSTKGKFLGCVTEKEDGNVRVTNR
jgi:hypothetical protein